MSTADHPSAARLGRFAGPSAQYAHIEVGPSWWATAASRHSATRWRANACPFEETRHSCYFLGQSGAAKLAQLAHMATGTAPVDQILRRLGGQRIVFRGDSVMRQLAQTVMCQLRRYLTSDGSRWSGPVQGYYGSESNASICAFPRNRHCYMEPSCSSFAVEAGSAQATICYERAPSSGWADTMDALSSAHPPNVLVFHSGRAPKPVAELARLWAAAEPREAVFRAARAHSTLLLFQQHEPQHYAAADGTYSSRLAGTASALCVPPPPYESPTVAIERDHVYGWMDAPHRALVATHNFSKALWWAHTSSAPTPSGQLDCTHWCMPGVPDVWAAEILRVVGMRLGVSWSRSVLEQIPAPLLLPPPSRESLRMAAGRRLAGLRVAP